MVGLNEIKIKEGKITTLIGERCCGMTTLLCTFIKKALDNNGKVLVISDKARSAKELFDKLNDDNCISKNIIFKNIFNLHKEVGFKYDLIVYDTPDIFELYNPEVMDFLSLFKDSKIIIGITWENIAFNREVNKCIKKQFILKSNYSYYLTSRYNSENNSIYEIKINDIIEDVFH